MNGRFLPRRTGEGIQMGNANKNNALWGPQENFELEVVIDVSEVLKDVVVSGEKL